MAGWLREHHPLSHSPDRSPATARRLGSWRGGCGSSFGVGMHVSEAVQEQLPVPTSRQPLFLRALAFPLPSSSSDIRSRAAEILSFRNLRAWLPGQERPLGGMFSSVSYWLYECPFSKMFGGRPGSNRRTLPS